MSTGPLVTRFAPSPTGLLHLGNARTALLNYLAARKSGGRFVLRIEDTDEARSEESFLKQLLEDLRWLGLAWDEGPDVGGPHGSYRQQERRHIYGEWLQKLDAAALTYPCFCSQAELSIARKQQLAAGKPPRYPGTCRELSSQQRAERLAKGLAATLRFKVPRGVTVTFEDLVHGPQRFQSDDIGDFIIQRTDGSTAFFFSNAVDDALMGITLVLRGDDHMTNTPRQILILQALGLPVPQYAHVALLLGMDGAPLSKRNGALSLQELRASGYLPSAVCNHLVRLGHTTKDGWLDEHALVEEFDLTRLGRAAAKFDLAQLRHWQKEAVSRLDAYQFSSWAGVDLPAHVSDAQRAAFAAAIRHNVTFPADAQRWAEMVFAPVSSLDGEALQSVRAAGAGFFVTAREVLTNADVDFKQATKDLAARTGRKGPQLFMPLRAALTGTTHGPELAPLLPLIGSQELARRLEQAQQLAA